MNQNHNVMPFLINEDGNNKEDKREFGEDAET